MTITYIRDNHLAVIATITKTVHGAFITNTHGNLLGTYQEDVDITNDAHGNFVGKGNLLTMLIERN